MSSQPSLARPAVDFVSVDIDALASHMRHCAQARGRWFALACHLQQARSAASGRLVTLACVAVLAGAALLAIA
jgi:hypothetical protein